MAGDYVNVSSIGAQPVIVPQEDLDRVETGENGEKTVYLKNKVKFVFNPNDLEKSGFYGRIGIKDGFTSFDHITTKMKSKMASISGTEGNDRIIVTNCQNINVAPGLGNDFVNVLKSKAAFVTTSVGGSGITFGVDSIGYDNGTEVKNIPGGYKWEYDVCTGK